jgi:endonuclease/exonuclease/phosphatase family metal-dependent hydrolase
VLSELASNKIDVCCLQEIELKHDYPINLLGSNTFDFEVETNDNKRRVGILIKNTLKYKRRVDLEKKNCHLIIIDLELDKTIRIITLYRSFRPTDRLLAKELFTKQLDLIRSNTIPNTILLGDFNLDAEMQHRLDYPHRKLFDLLDQVTSQFNLIQLVKFPTWSRKVNNTFKQSTLDHIYVNNPFNVGEPFSMHPLFGDHSPVVIEVNSNSNVQATEIRRDWRFYSIASCRAVFSDVNFNIDCTDVQAFWNLFENLVINEVDKLAPLVTFRNDQAPKVKPPLLI